MESNFNNLPVDMSMVGFCPTKILKSEARFALRNLVNTTDKEVMSIQGELLRFLAEEIFELPPQKTEGLILHSGTEANEVALLLAKKATGKRVVITSNLSHDSIERVCEKLEMDLVKVDINQNTLKVDLPQLKNTLEKHGDRVAALNITYGTTALGSGEDFEFDGEVEKIIRDKNIWVHIDAAYGGIIMNLSGFENRAWQKSSLARSLTVDPHKFVGAFGCGVLLLTNPSDKKLIGPDATYFPGNATALGTTRSAYPAATALATIKWLGIDKLKKLALQCVRNAKSLERNLKKVGFVMITPVQSGIVSISVDSESNVEHVRVELLKRGFMVSPIIILGSSYKIFGVRIVVNPRPELTLETLRTLKEALVEVRKDFSPKIIAPAA